ncbi:MAG TPA: glycosyltransferase [Acidimicrobiia bacterium]|nr:glycosyltransferase [Acidimicrobiia bacterium]
MFIPVADPRVHNPIGWRRQPANGVLALTWSALAEADVGLLDPVADEVHLYGPRADGFFPGHHNVKHPEPDRLSVIVKRYRAVFLPSGAESRDELSWALAAIASGTPVMSRPSTVLDALLPDRYVRVESPQDVTNAFDRLSDEVERGRLSVSARRHVFMTHTPRSRFEQILHQIGIPVVAPERITVLAATKRPEQVQRLLESFAVQRWPRKELSLLLHGVERFNVAEVQRLLERVDDPTQVVGCPDRWTLGDCLNAGLDAANGEYVAKMDDDDHYGSHHLTDLVLAARYSGAAAVGKLANTTYLTASDVMVDWRIDDQERFVHHLPGATMLARTELVRRYGFRRVNRSVDSMLWERMTAEGHRLYSTHWFDFVRVRHDDNTYVRGDEDFLKLATRPPLAGLTLERWIS